MTVFNTPIIKHFLRFIGAVILKLAGWKADPRIPVEKKYVIVVYPHTSNWDFPLGMAYTFVSGHDVQWMGKDTLFKGIAGPIMRWLGGLSINRSKAFNVVAQTITAFKEREQMVVVIPPEGTRGYGKFWKSGFYRIAIGADVPVALGYLDYNKKMVGLGDVIRLTGNEEEDMEKIRDFYKDMVAMHPEEAAPILFKPRPLSAKNK